jgi:hypothetical protein
MINSKHKRQLREMRRSGVMEVFTGGGARDVSEKFGNSIDRSSFLFKTAQRHSFKGHPPQTSAHSLFQQPRLAQPFEGYFGFVEARPTNVFPLIQRQRPIWGSRGLSLMA